MPENVNEKIALTEAMTLCPNCAVAEAMGES